MPSVYTSNLRFEEQGIGENNNTWGERLNRTINSIDDAIAGTKNINVASGTVVLTTVNNDEDEARYKILKLAGSLSGDVVVQVPDNSKTYIVWDTTTRGGFSITFRVGAAGDTVVIPYTGRTYHVVTDGTDIVLNGYTAASATEAGVVELATDAEVQTGTDATRAVTPASFTAGLQSSSAEATESKRGTVELATQTEVNTGTDTVRVITAATLAGRTATETRAGVIELADQTEVNTGTDAARAVTPATLAGRSATETRAGVIEIATQTETNDGTDNTRAVTPLKMETRLDTRLGTTGNLGSMALQSTSSYVPKSSFDPTSPTLVWSGSSASVNMSSLSQQGTGLYLVRINTGPGFSSAIFTMFVIAGSRSCSGMNIYDSLTDPVYDWVTFTGSAFTGESMLLDVSGPSSSYSDSFITAIWKV